jgi:hypothetical protein
MPATLTSPAGVFTFGILLLGSQSAMTAAYGRIGETRAQCDQRYDRKEGWKIRNGISEVGPRNLIEYTKNGYDIGCAFDGHDDSARCTRITYTAFNSHPLKHPPARIAAKSLLDANGTGWRLRFEATSLADGMEWQRVVWVSKEGTRAAWYGHLPPGAMTHPPGSMPSGLFIFESAEYVTTVEGAALWADPAGNGPPLGERDNFDVWSADISPYERIRILKEREGKSKTPQTFFNWRGQN